MVCPLYHILYCGSLLSRERVLGSASVDSNFPSTDSSVTVLHHNTSYLHYAKSPLHIWTVHTVPAHRTRRIGLESKSLDGMDPWWLRKRDAFPVTSQETHRTVFTVVCTLASICVDVVCWSVVYSECWHVLCVCWCIWEYCSTWMC